MHRYRAMRPRNYTQALLGGLLALALLCLSAASIQADDEPLRLPEIGDPASVVMSPSQERALGDTILTQIRGALRVTKDPELDDYIQALGTRLIAGGLDSGLDFSFLLIEDDNINAFAAPGGIVAVNPGLLLTAHNERELAGDRKSTSLNSS